MLAPPAIPSNARCVAAGLAVAACFACGGDAPAPTAPSAVVVRSLTVVLVRAEPGYQATAVAAFSDGSSREVTREAQWSSSNPAVAAVSETGSVSVITSGTAEIRGTYQSVTGSAQLTVAEPPPPPPPAAQHRVTVKVRDALDQASVSNVKITMVPAEQSDGPVGFTTGAGELSLTRAWGPYVTVHAKQEGYALKAVQQAVTDDTRIDITLDPLPFTLSGTLRESGTGDAVACQPVRVEIVNGPDGGRAVEVRSQPGHGGPIPYEMTNVRPGRFTVRASSPPSAPACGSQEKTERFRGQPDLNMAHFTLLKPPRRPPEIRPPATIAVGGPGVLVEFPASSPVGRLQFMGTAGRAVTVRLTGNTIGALTLWLLSSGGGEVYSISSLNSAFTLEATLRSTAIYEIRVEPNPNPPGPATGSVTVRVTSP